MLGFLFDLFDDLYHDKCRAQVFVLLFFKFHEFFQSHLGFVFWRSLTFLWRGTLPWWSIVFSAFYTARGTDIFLFNSRLVCLDLGVFGMLWRVSFSSFFLFNNLALVFDAWCENRSACISSAQHLGFLLLENFDLFPGCFKLNFKRFDSVFVLKWFFLFIVSQSFFFSSRGKGLKSFKLFFMNFLQLLNLSFIVFWNSGLNTFNRWNVTIFLLQICLVLFLKVLELPFVLLL